MDKINNVSKCQSIIIIIFILFVTSKVHSESYLYIVIYPNERQINGERLFIQRDGPFLKRQYGLENRFDLGHDFTFEIDFTLRCSICSFSDPPEEFKYDIRLSKTLFDKFVIAFTHGRLHNFSREDRGSYQGYGIYSTGFEFGIEFK